jgi:hypothetical protein
MDERYRTQRLDDIPSPIETPSGAPEWKPIRHHFDVRAFGVNANVAHSAGDPVVEDHTEIQEGCMRHEELYLVTRGHARFSVAGETIDAPAGTLVFVRDPEARRGAVALEAGTTVLAIGGEPGVAYRVSPWEEKYFGAAG